MQTLAESAKVDGIAWLALSQFNRELEKRNDRRPQLSDLRGSGEIEEKCKLAVALYRGAYYGGRPKRDVDYECECPEAVRSCAHAPSLDEWERQVQLLILKGGNGPTGLVPASWDGPTTRIW
jgi:replicative DNA helicase